MTSTTMRGLNEFISDIRQCKDRDSETKRVEIQIAKIRDKFTNDKGLNAYQRKKYVWKLLYIHILGYEVDFGHYESSNLINSSKFEEKYTGYIASSLLINERNDDIWKSIVHSIETDLRNNNEKVQSLAFSMIGTLAPETLVSHVSDTIADIVLTGKFGMAVRKKAVLCLLRIMRKYPQKYDVKKWAGPVCEMFETKYNLLSFMSAAASLLQGIFAVANPEIYKDALPKVVRILHKLIISKQSTLDYLYYQSANPWLQTKLLKLLQCWSCPQEKAPLAMIQEIMTKVLRKTDGSKSVNKNNTDYGILFEAVNVVIHYGDGLAPKFMADVNKILTVFIQSTQANIRYLGLQAMCKLSSKQDLSTNLSFILPSLVDNDISIRKRALDLLYLIATNQTAKTIVEELLAYLETRADLLIKDELVLKIAILTEKFAQNLIWYVDMVVRLIQITEVEHDIWYRILQIITGFGQANPQLQSYAAEKLYDTMHLPKISETMKCIGAYVLSEYAENLSNKQPQKIFEILNKHFTNGTPKVKSMMLNAFVKLAVKFPELKDQVQMIFLLCSEHYDPDVQQRGVEYNVLLDEDDSVKKKVLSRITPYSSDQQHINPLLKRFAEIKNKQGKLIKSSNPVDPKKPLSEFEASTPTGTIITSHPLANHPLFNAAKTRMSAEVDNLLEIPLKLEVKPYVKQALVKKTPFEGIELKEMYEGGIGKVVLTLSVKSPQVQFKVFNSPGLDINVASIKYAEFPQILLVLTPNGQKIEPPTVGIAWKTNQGSITRTQLQLPIFVSKFLNSVELERQRFEGFYIQYSLKNRSYFKFDSFIKTAQPPLTTLKNIGSFLTSVCNFKCAPHPDINNLESIYGSCVISLKNPETGVQTNYPILIQVQAYPESNEFLRLSMRGGHGNTILAIYQEILVFF